MCWVILHLLILWTSIGQASAENEVEVAPSCPGDQTAFGRSCFAFVSQRLSFHTAQDWCEKRGGHLAFIPDKNTQNFLEKHLDPDKDVWLGMALTSSSSSSSSSSRNRQHVEGALSWLDGSPLTYTKWTRSPQPDAACGHILRSSSFQWESTNDCNQEMNFICQFESGRRIVCAGHDTSLQCSSKQVLMIDRGFYGRRNIHYCRAGASAPPSVQKECGWVDVKETIKAHCHGRRVCNISKVRDLMEELCPQLRSYLSVEYHCSDGLSLSVRNVAAVFEDVVIEVTLLANVQDLLCRLQTGDGQTISFRPPEGLKSRVMHKYTNPRTFVVKCDCSSPSGHMHFTAHKMLSIQEAVTQIGAIRCYARKKYFPETQCRALYGEAFHIQMEVKAGTNVAYRVQSGKQFLAGLSVLQGNVPKNITVTAETAQQLGSGCHRLTIYASNTVTTSEVSSDLQVCVLEKISGLQASILEDTVERFGAHRVAVKVSLKHGAPAHLSFLMNGEHSSLFETREMDLKTGTYFVQCPAKGCVQITIRAWNAFSSQKIDSLNDFNREQEKRLVRDSRSVVTISASPPSVSSQENFITLSLSDQSVLDGVSKFEWKCKGPCNCNDKYTNDNSPKIKGECLEPFHFNKYSLDLKGSSPKLDIKDVCITLTPTLYNGNDIRFTCTDGCVVEEQIKDANIQMECDNSCPKADWYIKETDDEKKWDAQTKDCYINANLIPLVDKDAEKTSYRVKKNKISEAKDQNKDVTVVIIFGDQSNQTEGTPTTVELLSCFASPSTGTILDAFNLTCTTLQPCAGCRFCFTADYKELVCSESKEVQTVFLPLGNSSSNYSLPIAVTVTNGSQSLNTTFTVQVLDFTPNPNSNDNLRAGVENALEKLKKSGRLSGETVGQIFSSVAKNLNNKPDASELREEMVDTMANIINEAPPSTPKDAEAVAEGLTALVQKGAELRVSVQVSASSLFEILSLSLMNMNVSRTEDGRNQVHTAASTIVAGIDFMLYNSVMKNVSDALLSTLSNIQSALLKLKEPNEGPTLINTELIIVLVNRVTPDTLLAQNLSFIDSSQPNFSLPQLPTNLLPSEGPVDIRMLSLAKNPFSWNEKGNISGLIGSLSLSTEDGSGIPVENLSEDIEIWLPRPAGEQVNTTVLDLGNYSTTIIDVPSADTSLVIKMEPSLDPLPFQLYLGFTDYPTETNYVAMTQMPLQGTTEEEKYTWIVQPEELKGNTGVHYLVVRPIVGPGIKSINASLSVTPIASSCRFWDESILDWSTTGCKVGVKTTPMATQCLCNHLTFFGSSFFVTPNLVDPSQTAQLFATFAENPVVVCFVGALFVTYLLVVVWARRKDIQDTAKVKVTVLHDNNPKDEYRYLLCVRTGHRIGASTSSQVIATLLGAEGNSEPHHLTDQRKPLFERGAVDMFLITTPSFLGELQGIRLWHDNSGSHPAWYVANIMVQDLQTEQKWNFLCNSWLSLDMGDCCIDSIFPVSTEEELKRFSNLFFMKTTRDFCDGHLWYSVVSRPAGSNFTCVQRVSCCFSLLLCTMLTSIMFYGIPTDPSEQDVARLADLLCKTSKNNIPTTESKFGAKEESEINTILSKMEDFIQERHKAGDNRRFHLPESGGHVNPPSVLEATKKKSNKTQHLYRKLCHIDKELSLLGPSSFQNPHSYTQALKQVQNMKRLIEDQQFPPSHVKVDEPKKFRPAEVAASDGKGKKTLCCHGMLPWWFVFVGWLLVIATSVVSGYFTMLYGLKFGKQRSISWLVSMIISFFQSLLFIQPLKVICLAVFFALIIRKVEEEDLHNVEFVEEKRTGETKDHDASGMKRLLYEPPPPEAIERMRRNKIMQQKAHALLKEILTYIGFLWMLLLVAYGQRDPNAFYLNQHIRSSFSGAASDSMSLQDVFTWANTTLLTNLFAEYPGFITDGNSKLVGNARVRQLRVKEDSCQTAGLMHPLVADCNAPYSWDVEDMGSYDTGWNRSLQDNISASTSSPWKYQTQTQLRGRLFWGKTGFYRGGGFAVELGPDLSNASSTLEYLFENKWLDMYTRAIFVEFTVYNANVNLFCIITLLMETTAVGVFQFYSELQSIRLYQSTDGLFFFVMAAEIIYLLFILYYMFLQAKLMRLQRWDYFRNKLNLLELSIILLSMSAVAIFIRRTLLGNRDVAYYQTHKDQFASFYDTATADQQLQYLIAFLVLLATVKCWNLLRLNPKMNLLTAALQRAWTDISSFLLIFGVLFVAYSVTSNLIYGWKLSSYKTFSDSLLTVISLQAGIFNYDEVLNGDPVLGGLLVGSCVVFMTFVLLNLLISLVLVALNREQLLHKPSEEEEVVDLLLSNIFSLIGIRYKDKKDTMTDSSGFALNNTKEITKSP
ncbi:Polycystic kidney disease protein 1-like 2 [Oryzias melastigma]|uniref:Polycystic kidney disease protein 1-like 2 n=1 Tax=Oryzias melastigma TaxID=30732 RepID=A0A834KUG0_ORYME|nr:Polycystic kidney disease protein 1-like 2 [Oryzias melastigma]